MDYGNLIHRTVDDSYIITKNGMPYHVPNAGEWEKEWADVHAWALDHPDRVTEEYPYETSLDELKDAKLSEINAAYDAATSALVATYPQTELLTFDKQEAEARAWTADHNAETPLVDMLAAGRQMDKAELIRRIIQKADTFTLAVGWLTGQRQHYEDLLKASETTEDVASIVPEYILPQGISS